MRAFRDRERAGDLLGRTLSGYADRSDVTVLGLVRGGVPVAARVSQALGAPLDVLVVRKLGVPWSPEVAFGALGPGGVRVLNPGVPERIGVDEVDAVVAYEQAELTRRELRYRADRPPLDLLGRVAIVVDDGLATGATAAAAATVVRQLGAARTVLAAPVGAPEAIAWLSRLADEVCCPLVPEDFGAVSRFYRSFEQVTDDEVVELLH
ncbi:phosphoribosyltransferase [Rugosimonospora acidiphila]|uniref:Phosphoribosyltransferase n=1 Tax=Rugosimonospora acidiphila TaxID=556531 RepID=A0ABP9RYK0_9ACTN